MKFNYFIYTILINFANGYKRHYRYSTSLYIYWNTMNHFNLENKYYLTYGNNINDFMNKDYLKKKNIINVGLFDNYDKINLEKYNDANNIIINGKLSDEIFFTNYFENIKIKIPFFDLKNKKKIIYESSRILKNNGELHIIDYDNTHPYKIEMLEIENQFNQNFNYMNYVKQKFIVKKVYSKNNMIHYIFNKKN